MARPKVNSSSQKELDKAQKDFDEFDKSIKDLTLDRMNAAPKQEVEQQTKLSQKELENSKDLYLKPKKKIGSVEKFNEKFRDQYEFAKEYVRFIAENIEIIGENIELWTKPFPGLPAELWEVPVNTPLWGPRYLAEQLSRCNYHRLKMTDQVTQTTGMGKMYGSMAVDSIVKRINATPVSNTKSIFMGASSF